MFIFYCFKIKTCFKSKIILTKYSFIEIKFTLSKTKLNVKIVLLEVYYFLVYYYCKFVVLRQTKALKSRPLKLKDT